MSAEYEAVEGVPSGLIACTLGGREMHILRISPRSLELRTDGELPACAPLVLFFYHPERGLYTRMEVEYALSGPLRREEFGASARLSISDPRYAAAVRRSLADLADYVRWRCEGGIERCTQEMTDCPDLTDDNCCASLAEQYDEWFGDGAPIAAAPQGRELALTLGDPDQWEAFLHRGDASLWTVYTDRRGVPRSLFPGEEPQRLYIGSASCSELFPELAYLSKLLDKAARDGLAVTLLLPPLRTGSVHRVDALMELLAARNQAVELAVNDWGMLERAAKRPDCAELVLGPLLNKLRRDPRMVWKPGYEAHRDLFAENSLNDPAFRDFLGSLGVHRFEYEACGREIRIPEGRHSLHLPFCHTNASAWCTLKARCETGNRGAQGPVEGCPGFCRDNAFLYPRPLRLIGRGNALLMLQRSINTLTPQIDRLVYNL